MSKFLRGLDSNPLLEGFEVEIDRQSWWRRLREDPFSEEDLSTLSSCRRDLLLDEFVRLYVPTESTVEIAYQIHRMIIGGWISRHPYQDDQRRLIYTLANFEGKKPLELLSTSTRGMLLEGSTKLGKSRLLERVRAQYPQVIRREQDKRAGWLGLDQLVYLVIPMSTDASKGGFVMQAFQALDMALGTNYREKAIRASSVEIQLVQLLAKLAAHRCGLLMFEEAQESNDLAKTRFGSTYQSFFLRVLNSGIPCILEGNPYAFEELKLSSQLMSRLSRSHHMMAPAPSPDAKSWTEDLVPGIWGQSLLPEADDPIENMNVYLWEQTGGFPHYLSVLRREALRAALDRRSSFVSQVHIEAALATTEMIEGRKIIEAHWKGRHNEEVSYADIPGDRGLVRPDRGRRRAA